MAHVFSDLAGHRMRHGEHPSAKDLRHEAAIARPIVTSAVLPALVLATCCLGWTGGRLAVPLALGVLALRLAWIGSVMTHRSGQHSSWRVVASGLGFALAALLVAALKTMLSH